ncbi:MAG: glycosyltransferase family 4 protein [Candidatus Helarchaeota archaeon]
MTNEKKLKIGFVIPYFVPAFRFGGPVRGTYEIGKRLAKKGHIIKIFCTDVSNNPKLRVKHKNKIIDGMHVYYFKNISNCLASKYKIFLPINFINQIRLEIQDLDIIHFQDLYNIMTLSIYYIVKKKKIPIFISTRGVFSDFAQKNRKYIKFFLNRIFFKILKKVDLIFAQTIKEKEDCLKFGLLHTKILENGINPFNFNINIPSNFRKKYNFNDDDIIVLYLGRIHKIKGLEYLIKSIAKLRNFEKLKLVLIGPDDNYWSKLKNLIKKLKIEQKVLYINGLYGKDKFEAYTSSNIFCLPSLYDCSPNSMLEACASGLPIITTKNNGLSYILKKGGGIIIPPKNVTKLTEALIYFINNPDKIKENGQFIKKKVLKEFNWDTITDRLEQYYYNILKKNL